MFGWGLYGGGIEAIGVSYMHDRAGEPDTDVLINGASLFDMAENGDYSDIWDGPIDFDPYIAAIGDEDVAKEISDSFIDDGIVPLNDDPSIEDAAWRWAEQYDSEYGPGSPESRYAFALAGSIRGGEAVMRMRFFTNREDGDYSHLLDWRHPLTEVNRKRVLKTLEDLMAEYDAKPYEMDAMFGRDWRKQELSGQSAYYRVADFFRHMAESDNPEKDASEALYAHGIDGVRYEAGEVQGKPEDAEPAYDYVAFSDEHIVVEAIGRENKNGELEWEELVKPGNTALSVGDGAYLDAVRRGDMGAARRMVEDAAQQADYPYFALHGSPLLGFTRLKTRSFYAAESELTARTYTYIKGRSEPDARVKTIAETRGVWPERRPFVFDANRSFQTLDELFDALREAGATVKPYGDGIVKVEFASGPYTVSRTIKDIPQGIERMGEAAFAGQLAREITESLNDPNYRPSLFDVPFDISKQTKGMYRVALRMRNPLVADAKGGSWEDAFSDLFGEVGGEINTYIVEQYAKEHGYDGIIVHNVDDTGGNSRYKDPVIDTVYVVFDSAQVKSLDPVTYDDNGNVIPLSQRFNPANPDIRFSVGSRMGRWESEPGFAAVRPAEVGRQRRAGAYYPDIGGWIANTAFSIGERRKAEYRAVIGKKRPDLPSADVDAFMGELDKLGNTKAEKAALHWFVKGGLQLPQDGEVLRKALEVSTSFKLDPFKTGTPQEVLRMASQMARARSKELQGPFLGPDDIGLTLEEDYGNGLKVYSVKEYNQDDIWRLMRSQGYIFVNPETNKVVASSPWCLLEPTESGSRPSQSAINYWGGDQEKLDEYAQKREEHEAWVAEERAKWEEEHKDDEWPEEFPEEDYEYDDSDEDVWAKGYTGAPKMAAFFRDRIVAFSGVLDQGDSNYSTNVDWWDLDDKEHGYDLEFFWDGTAEQMGLTHLPPDTPVHVEGNENTTDMTVGDEQNGIYEFYADNELTERALYKDGKRVRDLPLDDVDDIATLLDSAPGNVALSLGEGFKQRLDGVNARIFRKLEPLTRGQDAHLYREGFGDVRYPFSDSDKKGREAATGFVHIVRQRLRKDVDDLDDAVAIAVLVADAVENGEKKPGRSSNTTYFDKDGIRAVVGTHDDGEKVVTGFQIWGSEGEKSAANFRSASRASLPHGSSEEMVASLANIIANRLGNGSGNTALSVGERPGRAPEVRPGGDVREAGESTLAWLRRKFVHAQTPVFDAVRRVMGVGREPPDALNVEAAAKNVHGKIRARQELLQRAYLEPLKAILAQPGMDRKRFDDYALALHALERNRMIQERSVVVDPTTGEVVDLGVEAGSGVTNAWAERVIRETERDPFAAQYKEAAQILAEMNRFVLRGAVADGLLTEAQAKTWMRLSPHYVPLKSGGAAPGAIHKRATGRFTRPDSVLVNSMRQAYATVRNGELNRVNKTMADWIREYDPNGEQVGGTVPESHKHAKIKMADPQYVPKGSTAEALLRERGIRLVETEDKGGYWVDTGVLPNALKRVVRESVPQGDDIVTFWENGERKFIRFEGKRGRDGRAENEAARIADALNFKNVLHKEGKFWDAIRGLTRWKANVSTSWNPTFIVRNMGADVFNTANLMMIEGKYAELARTMRNYPAALNRVERSSHAWVSFTDGAFLLAEVA